MQNPVRKHSVIVVDKNKTASALPLKKSLSYNDLANEIANLFSKPKKKSNSNIKINQDDVNTATNANPRKTSGQRRASKTFRRTPTIIIHPPEETTDRVTNSCPDIQALLTQEQNKISVDDFARHDLNYSCPDINNLPDTPPSPSPNLPKLLLNNNLSRSCPNINSLLLLSLQKDNNSKLIKNNNNSSYNNDFAISCPNINDTSSIIDDNNKYKSQTSIESTESTFDDSFDYKFNDYNGSKRYSPTKSYEHFTKPFEQCIYELDILKNEVNDIKNECECLLYECSCQQREKYYEKVNNDYKITHYNTPTSKNHLKLLPTRNVIDYANNININNNNKIRTSARINRKISFSNLPYAPRSNDILLSTSCARTSSEPNLLRNMSNFRTYNRSCSDVGQQITQHNKNPDVLLSRPNSLLNIGSNDDNSSLPPSLSQQKQRLSFKKSPKKHDISPTDILRYKMKQSLSMFDLNASKPDENYDCYHTIHGGMKLPKDLTDFTLRNYKNYKEECGDRQSASLNQSWSGAKGVFQNENLVAVVKCCCGDKGCRNGRMQVMPITFQQLLDANLTRDTVRPNANNIQCIFTWFGHLNSLTNHYS